MIMTLLGWFLLTAVLIPLLYLWRRPAGILAGLAALLAPGGLYLWAGLSLRTYAWSWALPLLAGQCLLIPLSRFLYVRFCRLFNGWSKFTLEIEDSNGHLHYVKGINQGTYINGGQRQDRELQYGLCPARRAVRHVCSGPRPEEVRAFGGSLSDLPGCRSPVPCLCAVRP